MESTWGTLENDWLHPPELPFVAHPQILDLGPQKNKNKIDLVSSLKSAASPDIGNHVLSLRQLLD